MAPPWHSTASLSSAEAVTSRLLKFMKAGLFQTFVSNHAIDAQTWCRGKKKWESETLCLDCHHFSWRSYCDPDFKTPEDYEKERWESFVKAGAAPVTASA